VSDNKNFIIISAAIGLLLGLEILPRLFDPFDQYNLFFKNTLGIILFVNLVSGFIGLILGLYFATLMINLKLDKKDQKLQKNKLLSVYLYSAIIYYSILTIKQAYFHKTSLPFSLEILISLFSTFFILYNLFCLVYFIKNKFPLKIYSLPILNLVILLISILSIILIASGTIQLVKENQALEESPIFWIANLQFILYLLQIFWVLYFILKFRNFDKNYFETED